MRPAPLAERRGERKVAAARDGARFCVDAPAMRGDRLRGQRCDGPHGRSGAASVGPSGLTGTGRALPATFASAGIRKV
ncbi:MAG: hypothetical protein ACOYL3_26420 [Desulfuromonadaceae bacterium]